MALAVAEAAVDDLTRSHRELLRLVDSLSEADWERAVPYGDWTVKDLIAHVIGDMSPGWPGLILAGVFTPQFIVDMGRGYDARTANAANVEERRRWTREDLRQMLFEAHDEMIDAARRLDESHLPVLDYVVPMGPEYELKVVDFIWRGAHDRQHADDIRRSLEVEYKPQALTFAPELERKMRWVVLSQDTYLRALYSVADDGWGEQALSDGWTYHDLAAHVSSNEARLQTRLRSALDEASDEELAAVNDIEAWNAKRVGERRGWSVREIADEFQAGRFGTMQLLSRFTSETLEEPVTRGDGSTVPASEFVKLLSRHTSAHAGQLVAGSRARRVSG
jgi:Mycothiol maleylpyruvate isomerase N-terminal domain/DinB superfamily